jgi:hypothetical protein
MKRIFISAVKPLDDYILQVDFESSSRLLLDMTPHLGRIRFRSLNKSEIWNSAKTDGVFVRFGDVEISHDELLTMAEQGSNSY